MSVKPHLCTLCGNLRMAAFKYVVVGGGNSSGYAAREFVNNGIQPGELLIITDEPVVAYERPALSKAYLAPEGAARLPGFHTCVGGGGERQTPEWYTEKGIEYRTNTKVTAADVTSKTLTLSTGESVSFGKLIIATGARPVYLTDFKTPGADLGGILYLRDIRDGEKLLEGIAKAKAAGNKAVVVGGGYIGMEVSAMLSLNGLDTTVVLPEDRLMARLFTPELAAKYEKFWGDKGIKLVHGALATSFEGSNGQVSEVVLKSGERLPADLVVVGVGARANVELFRGQVEEAAGGIKVDGHFRTSVPDVYAVGDVAAFPLLRDGGKLVRQEHVTHCRLSAAHAVSHILGLATTEYDYLPFFYSRSFSLSWVFYGFNTGTAVHFGPTPEAPSKWGAYWVDGERIRGAFLESGSAEENAALKALVAAAPAAPPSDELATQGVAFALSKI